MNYLILPKQCARTIHTPAIFDSPTEERKTRANAGFQQSTTELEAVHICGLRAESPSANRAFSWEVAQ